MKLEQDHKLWPGFLHSCPKPWLGCTEGEQSWQRHVFTHRVPGEKGLILTQLSAGIWLLSGTGVLQAVLPGPCRTRQGAEQRVCLSRDFVGVRSWCFKGELNVGVASALLCTQMCWVPRVYMHLCICTHIYTYMHTRMLPPHLC